MYTDYSKKISREEQKELKGFKSFIEKHAVLLDFLAKNIPEKGNLHGLRKGHEIYSRIQKMEFFAGYWVQKQVRHLKKAADILVKSGEVKKEYRIIAHHIILRALQKKDILGLKEELLKQTPERYKQTFNKLILMIQQTIAAFRWYSMLEKIEEAKILNEEKKDYKKRKFWNNLGLDPGIAGIGYF